MHPVWSHAAREPWAADWSLWVPHEGPSRQADLFLGGGMVAQGKLPCANQHLWLRLI